MIFKLNRKVRKGERSDKMPCESKSKAYLVDKILIKKCVEIMLVIFPTLSKRPKSFSVDPLVRL